MGDPSRRGKEHKAVREGGDTFARIGEEAGGGNGRLQGSETSQFWLEVPPPPSVRKKKWGGKRWGGGPSREAKLEGPCDTKTERNIHSDNVVGIKPLSLRDRNGPAVWGFVEDDKLGG